jgi:hypothetical protein
MHYLVAAAALFVAGCLPAYDNGPPAQMPDFAGADFAGDDLSMPDAAGGDLSGCQQSGKKVTGSLYSIELGGKPGGPVVNIEGYVDQMQFTGPTNGASQFSINLPDCVVGQSRYFVIDGMYMGTPITTTWVAPRVPMTGTGPQNLNIILHPYIDETQPTSVRGLLERALKDHGDIPVAKTLGTDYTWMYGWLPDVSNIGQAIPALSAVVQVSVPGGDGGLTVLDNTNCMPDAQCCVYYAYDIGIFNTTMPPSFIDFTQTSTFNGWYAIVCPGTETGDITLDQVAPLANLHDYMSSNKPKKNFPTITAPRMTGVGVFVDWQNL